MSKVTAKRLHLETEAILDDVEAGKTVIITRNGRPVARLQPVAETTQSPWAEIMSEVWAAQDKIKPAERVPNPVLIERGRYR